MTKVSGVEPPRLASRDDRAGRLLREAEQAFRAQLQPDRAWKRFQVRRQRRWFARFAVLAAAAAGAVVFARHRLERAPIEPPTLVAERVPATAPSSVLAPRTAPVDRRIPPPPSAVALTPSSSRVPAALSHSSRGAVAPLPAEAPPAEPLTEATCRGWVSQTRTERAVDCYLAIARETGLGAEVALYEAARLSAEALGNAPRALTLLEQHRARFPNSVLRVEVEWLQIRSLERAGRPDEALSASEALLDSAVGRALAPKLHLLRGRIYAGVRHDCRLALPEYVALLGEPGPAGDEAEFNRAQCLEQLQRPAEARAAYRRYLDRPDPRSAAAARVRLNAIDGVAEPLEGQP